MYGATALYADAIVLPTATISAGNAAVTAAEFIQAAENKNVSGMLSAAAKLTRNGDLSVAAQAARVVDVINNPKSSALTIAQTVGNFADTTFKLSKQGSETSKQITNAQNANNALRGSPLTPQQIESYVANGGNPEDLVGRQTGLRQEQVQAIGEAVTAYNNKEIDIYQLESRLKQTAGLSTDQADVVVNKVFNDNQVAITRQQNAVDIASVLS